MAGAPGALPSMALAIQRSYASLCSPNLVNTFVDVCVAVQVGCVVNEVDMCVADNVVAAAGVIVIVDAAL
eukprot:3994787-Pyramimonas_sp.AAC.1